MSARPLKLSLPSRPVDTREGLDVLGAMVATDAGALIELFDELIGERCSAEANTLACMRQIVARIGMVGDAIAQAHGDIGCRADLMGWLFDGDALAAAMKAQMAIAATQAAARAPGGAL